MKTIVVLIDFSYWSRNAAMYGLGLAGELGECKLVLANTGNIYAGDSQLKDLSEAHEEDCRERLEDMKEEFSVIKQPGTVIQCLPCVSDLTAVISELGGKEKIYLALAGGSEDTSDDLYYGIDAADLSEELQVPLLIVPPGVHYQGAMQKVLFACELKDVLRMPVGRINDFVRDFGSELYVLNVNTAKREYTDTDEVLEQGKLHKRLFISQPKYHYTTDRRPDEGIKNFVKKFGVDLVFVIHKKHGFFHRLLNKSVSEQLTRVISVPVIILTETEPVSETELNRYINHETGN